MIIKKNIIMMYFSLFVIVISGIVHFLHRSISWLDDYLYIMLSERGGSLEAYLLVILFLLPILSLGVAFVAYRRNPAHPLVPLFITLSLTFGSISLIAGGNGMIEYHFSIFMVLAALAYFEQTKLILISTVIFAIQHLGGYFTVPGLVCGIADYPFSVLLIHAVFLIFTSAVIILQIQVRQSYYAQLKKEKDQY